MSFKSAVQSIGKGIKDLSQLNVVTFTGTIGADVGDTAAEAIASARTSGTAKLVGATTISLDGDVNQFISDDSTIQDKLHSAHFNAVLAGQKSRDSALEMFRSAVSKAVNKIDIDPGQD
jgi:hypothetical protein